MFTVLLKHLRIIITWGIIFGLAVGVVSLFLPKYYSATSQVLIISRDRNGVDPYTQSKSAERIGENLSQVVATTDFYDKVMESAINFDKERWSALSERDARKQWQKDISGSMIYNTGLMNLTVYSITKEDTLALAKAATDVLVSRGWEYVGGDVALKAVNNPLVSRLPGRPNYIFNILAGFLLGVLIASFMVSHSFKHASYGKNL
ncbi:MAG: Wzz/FepE/Etk N-terminal domain-containing protein [Candidatus Magasanikbacteria bacterium]